MAINLRDYQLKVKADIYKHWEAGVKNVLLVMPTGGGKTKTFCSIAIDKTIGELVPEKRLPTAIMVHRKELVQQICLTLAEEGIPHNIIAPRPVIQGIIAAERQVLKRSYYDHRAMVTVISVDTLNARILKHQDWARSIKLCITDEAAHVLKQNKWGRAMAYFPNAITLGVTATPERLDKRGLGSHADGVFDVMVLGPSSRWMIEQGFLSKYKIAIPESDYQTYLKAAAGDADYTREAMAIASLKSHIVGDVVKNYIRLAKGKQCIVFASDIAAGEKMEREFHANGITAKILTGETEDSVRLKSLIDFRDRKINVLINVDLFDEGLDVPGIEVVSMARPTKSLGKFLQMVGRGLRPIKGKEYLILIDHVGNVSEHNLPDTPRRWTLNRIIRRRQKVNLIRICKNYACNSPFDRIMHICPYCGTEDTPGTREGSGRVSPKTVDGDLTLIDPETYRDLVAGTNLESPMQINERVSAAAGTIAGAGAAKKQAERIGVQKQLAEKIAHWAGHQRDLGYADRTIMKKFYAHFEKTIYEALGEPSAMMKETIQEIEDARELW